MSKKVTIEEKVISFIEKHNCVLPGEKLVVGVSGGADSVCLLHFLSQQREHLQLKLHVAHLNHQLRGAESDADAEYVSDLAQRLGLPVTIERADIKDYQKKRRCSLEEAAREVRYNFLARVAKETGADRIAVGHTRDDQVETILMHLIRGTGTAGLRGLEPCSEILIEGQKLKVVRPLLVITRKEAFDYCQTHQLMPRSDSSNVSLAFFRNRLRHELLPLLRKYNPNFDEALVRLSQIAGDEASFLQEWARQLWAEVAEEKMEAIYLDKAKISALPKAGQRQLLRLAVAHLLGDVKDFEAEHIEAMLNLMAGHSGKRLNLPRGLTFTIEYSQGVLRKGKTILCPFPPLSGEFPLNIPGETILPGWRVLATVSPEWIAAETDNFVAYFDFNKTGDCLWVRRRQPGDRFQPLGMEEIKKLQDFMVDAKIPRQWRDHIPLVCSPWHILWVVGWRIDDRVKVTKTTMEILCLEFMRLDIDC